MSINEDKDVRWQSATDRSHSWSKIFYYLFYSATLLLVWGTQFLYLFYHSMAKHPKPKRYLDSVKITPPKMTPPLHLSPSRAHLVIHLRCFGHFKILFDHFHFKYSKILIKLPKIKNGKCCWNGVIFFLNSHETHTTYHVASLGTMQCSVVNLVEVFWLFNFFFFNFFCLNFAALMQI